MRRILALILCLWAQITPAQTLNVTDAAGLRAALQSTPAGSVVLLAAGDYGALDWRGGRGVTLRGQGTAVLTGLTLTDAHDIRFEGLTFDYRFGAGDAPHLRPFAVTDSQGIVFDRVLFDGDLAQDGPAATRGYPTAYGLSIRDSRDVTVTRSRIMGFLRGLVVSNSAGLQITGNDISGMRSDGINLAQVRDVTIAGNHIHDFTRALQSDDHADMIQVWTNGTTAPSRNIVIAGNVLNAGQGAYTQSIFMRNDQVDRGLAGPEMFYRAVQITGNLIINAQTHGITVGETAGLIIAQNTVVQNPQAAGDTQNESLWVPRIHVSEDARAVQITGNVVAAITGHAGQGGWQVADNLLVQNTQPTAAGYYGTVFGPAALTDPGAAGAFRLAPPYANPGLGADIAATP